MRILVTSLVLVLASGCSGGGFRPEDATSVTVAEALPPADPMVTPPASDAYRLGPADRLQVSVYGIEELQAAGMVDTGGFFPMPLVGPIQATGLTTVEFSDAIEARLRERYVRDPQVTVSLVEALSQRVTLDGAVRTPGRYPIMGPTTLTEALSLGQGTSEYARTSQVLIFRTVEGRRYAGVFSLRDIRRGQSVDPRVYGGDVVVVGTDNVRLALRDLAQASPLLGLFVLLR